MQEDLFLLQEKTSMPVQLPTREEIQQRLHSIEDRLEQEIDIVNRKLDSDIKVLQQAAEQEVDLLKSNAERNRNEEIKQATQQIENQTQVLVGQLQDMSE